MIREDDLLLSKMSYTDKDFASIYPDLLDLAKQLTDKWDPSLSNESDPGVVLLKEGAFIADHGNYNIDKNVLENFLPSATQETSVRNILDMNGYTPEYYVSATGPVSVTYNPEETPETFSGFIIPPFTLVVTNDDETVSYTQTSSLSINNIGEASSATFMEGVKRSLDINGETTILLENLDDNNRIYFPIAQVAENGIFIKNVVTTTTETNNYWVKKNYIATQPLNSKVYKVGYDSSLGVPYVEFPSDIANIIGNGLTIDYIVTTGINGNIKAGTLKSISTPTLFTTESGDIETKDFDVTNSSSIMNGKDPATINEMYRAFKKVVGTFDTLVTCQDYSNAIYNAVDGTKKLISNAVATDRNTDYNNSFKIITYDEFGEYFEPASKLLQPRRFKLYTSVPATPAVGDLVYIAASSEEEAHYEVCTSITTTPATWQTVTELGYNDFVAVTEAMTPFDLCLYILQAFSMSDYISSVPAKAIENSFRPLIESKDEDKVKYDAIKASLEENKCICHDIMSMKNGDVFCFKNYVPLNITITPYSKVTKAEKEEIIDNIYQALTLHFNASQVDFGEELNYDEVLQVLLNSDDRIKNIRLEDFTYNPVAMIKDNSKTAGYSEVSLYDADGTTGAGILLDVVAKNVLAGRLCLFDFDDEFTLKYGQINNTAYNNIASIQTEAVITSSTNSDVSYSNVNTTNTTIKTVNDAIQTKIRIYGANGSPQKAITIADNASYTLDPTLGEVLAVDIKGVAREYIPDEAEHSIKITNHTGAIIQLSYSGTTASWVTLVNDTSKYITLESTYSVASSESYQLDYEVKQNEYIEIAYNNYITDAIFPTYVKYRYVGATVAANTDHLLGAGETLILVYTENDVQKSKIYSTGEVIRANFTLEATDSVSTAGTVISVDGLAEAKYLILTSSQQLEHRQLMETQLSAAHTPCYWVVNNDSNTLSFNSNNERILGSGEYFIYSNSSKDSMVMLGPGTLLRKSSTDTNTWSIPNHTTFKDIEANGFNANIEWKYQDFSGTKQFTHQEMNIITLAEQDVIKINGWGTGTVTIDNTWKNCTGTITYELTTGETVTLPTLPTGEYYQIRSRLDISLNQDIGQRLGSGQSFTIIYEDTTTDPTVISGSDTTPVYLQASTDLNLYGDSTISIADYTNGTAQLDFNKYIIEKPILHLYEYVAQLSGTVNAATAYYKISNNKYVQIPASEVQTWIATYGVEGVLTFTTLYEHCTYLWYTKSVNTIDTVIEEVNGKYSIDITAPGFAEFKFGYKTTLGSLSDDHRDYLLPVYLNYGGTPITAELEDTSESSEALTFNICDYNLTTPAADIDLEKSAMYLLNGVVTDTFTTETEINTTVKLTLSWDTIPTGAEVVTLQNPSVIKGVNSGFGPNISLSDVLTKISSLIANSTKQNVKPYYIYRPDDSIAIQNPDVMDPNIFWDKNNIINCLTIPQIDIRTMSDVNNPTVDIIKSMRNYK